MPDLLYQHPADLAEGTWTVETGVEDSEYPAAGLGTVDLTRPAKLTGMSGAWVFDAGSADPLALVAIPHHNLDEGLDVRWQMHTVLGDWANAPEDRAIVVPASSEDGYGAGLLLLLTDVETSYRYRRLVIGEANSAPPAIGLVWQGRTSRTLSLSQSPGLGVIPERPIVAHRTEGRAVLVYDVGVTVRALQGSVTDAPAGAAAVHAWWLAARGRARPFVIALDDEVEAAVWLARFAAPALARQWPQPPYRVLELALEDVSRGLVL